MKENESGNRNMKILLTAILAVLLLILAGGVALFLKSHLEESDDCDVGPWGSWTSCYLPPRTCGIGSKNRTREKRADATHKGEKCAELRIIEVVDYLNCEVPCTPVDCEVGPWGNWSSCSLTCGTGTKERTREKIADAVNDGVECLAERSLISLTEQTTCKEEDCPGEEVLVRKQVGNPQSCHKAKEILRLF